MADLLDGRYRLGRLLGENAIGTLHEAEDVAGARRVQIRRLFPGVADHPPAIEAFAQDAIAIHRAGHPGLGVVLDIVTRGEGSYLVVAPFDGVAVFELRDVPLPPPRARAIAAKAARAIAAAHDHGVLHRDLDPGKVLVGDGDAVQVIDFGVARLLYDRPGGHALMGNPLYLAPEVVFGQPLTAATDVYGLGEILYYLLTGTAPCDGDSIADVLAHKRAPVRSPDPVVVQALDPEPSRRFASMQAFADALER